MLTWLLPEELEPALRDIQDQWTSRYSACENVCLSSLRRALLCPAQKPVREYVEDNSYYHKNSRNFSNTKDIFQFCFSVLWSTTWTAVINKSFMHLKVHLSFIGSAGFSYERVLKMFLLFQRCLINISKGKGLLLRHPQVFPSFFVLFMPSAVRPKWPINWRAFWASTWCGRNTRMLKRCLRNKVIRSTLYNAKLTEDKPGSCATHTAIFAPSYCKVYRKVNIW